MESRVCEAGQNSVLHRLNFLLQASQLYSLLSPNLSSSYCESAYRISRRKLVKIEPESKSLWCKTCSNHLIIGKTCDVFLESTKTRGKRSSFGQTRKREVTVRNEMGKNKEAPDEFQFKVTLDSKQCDTGPLDNKKSKHYTAPHNETTNILMQCYRCKRKKRCFYQRPTVLNSE
ncbi:hypothetical protein FG386_003125 [Cryptosporidium ryanae]|uniref:uncharacterized protein n=1 Tax=Cryptosporidium ryanae TaxID=515981 RepID=UPI00351A614B|nr:hypothetical protein FG386_003125 [Cryptosporidium ryanae]